MTLDVLAALTSDLDRLLQAGACIAPHDEALRARRAALAALVERVPALLPVLARLDALLAAAPAAAPAELLALAQTVARANAALARAPVEPVATSLAPLPVLPPLHSDAPAALLVSLRQAVAQWRPWADPTVVRQLGSNGAFRDVRAVALWLGALAIPGLGEVVAAEVVPRFGPGFAGVLRHGLRVRDGDAGDGLRLVCLAALAPDACAPLAAEAWAHGAAAVRGGALRALVRIAPEHHAASARQTLADGRADETLRAHAACALAHARDEPSLEALCAVVACETEEPAVRTAAARALGAQAHPVAAARIDALLTGVLARLHPLAVYTDPQFVTAGVLLEALAARLTPQSAARLAQIARTAANHALRERALGLAREADSPLGLEALVANAPGGAECAALWPSVRARIDAGDRRLVPLLCALVGRLDRADRYLAYYALRDLGDPAALPSLRARARQMHTLESTEAYMLVQVLDALENVQRQQRRAGTPPRAGAPGPAPASRPT